MVHFDSLWRPFEEGLGLETARLGCGSSDDCTAPCSSSSEPRTSCNSERADWGENASSLRSSAAPWCRNLAPSCSSSLWRSGASWQLNNEGKSSTVLLSSQRRREVRWPSAGDRLNSCPWLGGHYPCWILFRLRRSAKCLVLSPTIWIGGW